MIHIHCEGTEFKYRSAQEVENEEASGISIGVDVAIVEQLKKGSDTRLVFFRNPLPPGQWLPYWLVWQNPPDLMALDQRVRDRVYKDEDFAGAFRTDLRRTRCFTCGEVFRTLVVDAGASYPNAPHLHREKITKLRILPCPKCGSSLRQLVAKIVA